MRRNEKFKKENRDISRMKKICMVAYTNYLNDARPRREAETLVRRGDHVDFIALGEKDRPSFEIVQGVNCFE